MGCLETVSSRDGLETQLLVSWYHRRPGFAALCLGLILVMRSLSWPCLDLFISHCSTEKAKP